MPPVPAPGIVSLQAIWLQEDQPVENTYHYHAANPIDVGVLTSVCETYKDWATANADWFHNACLLTKLIATDLSSGAGASVELAVIPPVQGTAGAGAMPNNATFAVKRQTGLRGRANRGRVYWIGVSSIGLAAGAQQLTPTYAAGLVNVSNELKTAQLTDNEMTEVIYHRGAGTGTPVTSYTFTDLFVDSQRRRLPGHNRHH